MKNAVAMQVLDGRENLQGIALDFDLSEAFASLEHFVESLVRT